MAFLLLFIFAVHAVFLSRLCACLRYWHHCNERVLRLDMLLALSLKRPVNHEDTIIGWLEWCSDGFIVLKTLQARCGCATHINLEGLLPMAQCMHHLFRCY